MSKIELIQMVTQLPEQTVEKLSLVAQGMLMAQGTTDRDDDQRSA